MLSEINSIIVGLELCYVNAVCRNIYYVNIRYHARVKSLVGSTVHVTWSSYLPLKKHYLKFKKKHEMYKIILIMFPQHSSWEFRLKLLMCECRFSSAGRLEGGGGSKGQMCMSTRGEWSPQDEFVYLRGGSGVWGQLSRFYYVLLLCKFDINNL